MSKKKRKKKNKSSFVHKKDFENLTNAFSILAKKSEENENDENENEEKERKFVISTPTLTLAYHNYKHTPVECCNHFLELSLRLQELNVKDKDKLTYLD